MDLSDYGRNLLYLARKNKINHPLEKYIVAIDLNLENSTLLKAIGEKIGIDVYNDTDPGYTLYFVLEDYLKNEESIENTKKKIDITLTEFSKKYPNLNDEETFTLYANRLINNTV